MVVILRLWFLFVYFLGLGSGLGVGFYHTPKTWVELRGV